MTKPKVAIWMPMPVALPNPGEVFKYFHDILRDAEEKKIGSHLPNARAGAMDMWRSKACDFAIRAGATHILMLDADHKHGPKDLCERLLKHNKDVVGSLNFAREDGRPCAIRADGKDIKRCTGLHEVAAIGTGSLLINLKIFELASFNQPWFYVPYEFMNRDIKKWGGEDGGFSINCRKAGVKMYCDTHLNSPHAQGTRWV